MLKKIKRPSKDEYYMGIAKEVAQRSTCVRNKLGAVIVRDDQIISTGYVGAPRKTKDCFEHGFCLRTRLNIPHGHRYELCRSVHGEMNAIINAARAGVSVLGGTMYLYGEDAATGELIDTFSCFICKKIIINSGLSEIVYSMKDGRLRKEKISDWAAAWNDKDMIDDENVYGQGRKIIPEEENYKLLEKRARQRK